jgi:hypothetical protein
MEPGAAPKFTTNIKGTFKALFDIIFSKYNLEIVNMDAVDHIWKCV